MNGSKWKYTTQIWSMVAALTFAGCQSNAEKPQDTMTSGTLTLTADESFRPVIEEEIKVFESNFPDAHIEASFKPESACMKDYLEGKAKMIITTRTLHPEEEAILAEKKVVSNHLAIAKDAIAVILHPDNPDSNLSLEVIRGVLTGIYPKKYTVVFDNQGSSTLRYMLDSLIPGEDLAAEVYAAKGNQAVLDYVSAQPNAMGFIGVSHVADYEDPQGLAFTNKVKVASLYQPEDRNYYQPYQAYIATDQYPLTRQLYYIHRENYTGLASGFSNFLAKEKGQLIFKQARLFPLKSDVIFREASVNQ